MNVKYNERVREKHVHKEFRKHTESGAIFQPVEHRESAI